ncbi:AsmA family protein [Bacteroidales bacterium OttesenSCG-928-A17]|nr:AsmA family protein [Bacteroidales bacterium OttesenSCG-928-A17]
MKKFLSIAAIVVAAILLILIILPFAFKGKIVEVAKKEVNKTMNARIDFESLGLNFFKSFPHATVSLSNFYISGVDEFEGDTLLFSKKISATVNLSSLFGESGYEISKIDIDGTKVHVIVLEDGKANWEIMESSVEAEEAEEISESDFRLQLKKLSINNSDIVYEDRAAAMNAQLKGINLILSGDMSADETTIKSKIAVDALSFIMDKIPYLSKVKSEANLDIVADLKNMKFTLADNELKLNEIKASIDGWVAMQEDESIEMDLKLNAPKTQFKDILSLIPAIYAKDFKDLKTSGEASLDAYVKGVMKDDLLPAFDAKLNVGDAMFQYPGMPKSVNQIHVDLRAYNEGGLADKTVVDISKFHFEMGGNPFDIRMNISNPVSDMNLKLSAVGKLNLDMIKEVYPLEDMELSGNLDANLNLATRMSYIEKELYDKVEASGNLNVNNMLIRMEDSDDIQLQNAHLGFSPRYVDLSNFSAQIGKNDISAQGKLENFIPYFMKNETLKGTLTVKSNYLNLNDFMTEGESTTSTDTTSIGVIEIPKNLDFNLSATLAHVIFDNLEMKNVAGTILVKDGKAEMKNVFMNALGGSMDVNGYYDSGKNPKQPEVSMNLDIKNASFAQTFSTFVTIQKLAPVFESVAGNFSTSFGFNSALGSDFMPILTSLTANGLLQSSSVEISNLPVLDGLAATLKNESLKDIKVKDLNLPFSIAEGRVNTKPFDLAFNGGNMNLSGSTGIDQTIDYIAKIDLGEKLSNKYLNSVSVKIGGTFKSPKFSLDTKAAAEGLIDNLAGSILGKDKTGNSATDDAGAKVGEEIDKQIENIRQKAKENGDKLVAEAEKQGQKLIDEANKTSNALLKAAAVKTAESAAKKLKDEAQKQADKLNEEAENQIKKLKGEE